MFKQAVSCWLVVVSVSVAWSDEPAPARPRTALRQRVDPKVLKEALNLPEYPGQSPESNAALLDDVQKLADKLKKDGDEPAAELLERFIAEHKRQVKALQYRAISAQDRQYMVVKLIEVNLDRIPEDSILHNASMVIPGKTQADCYKVYEEELDRLVERKHARALIEPALRVRADGNTHHLPAEEFPVPLRNGAVTMEFRDVGITIEAVPARIDEQKVRLSASCECSETDSLGKIKTSKAQDTFEMILGETAVQGLSTSPGSRHKWFMVYKFLPRS